MLELSTFSFKSDQQPSLRTSNCRNPCPFEGYMIYVWNCMDMQVVNIHQLPDLGTGRRVKEWALSPAPTCRCTPPISLSPSLKSWRCHWIILNHIGIYWIHWHDLSTPLPALPACRSEDCHSCFALWRSLEGADGGPSNEHRHRKTWRRNQCCLRCLWLMQPSAVQWRAQVQIFEQCSLTNMFGYRCFHPAQSHWLPVFFVKPSMEPSFEWLKSDWLLKPPGYGAGAADLGQPVDLQLPASDQHRRFFNCFPCCQCLGS